MYHSSLIHSSVSGHLACFHVLAVVNSAAMTNGAGMTAWDKWREYLMETYILLYVKQTASGDLLYGSRSSHQGSVTT